MSRFGNLEFDGQSADENQSARPQGDEANCLKEARECFEQAEFEKALRAYSRTLEFNPHSRGAWSGQVRALIELGEFREAALWADKALEQFPNEPELLAAKAVALGRNGDLQEAIALSDAAIEERGDTPYVWLARGDVLLARREQRAEYCLEKALALARGDWVITWLAARIRFYYEQFALAMKLLQAALEANGGRPVLWVELGACQVELGLAGAAQRSFAQARQLNPDYALARQAARPVRVGWRKRAVRWWRRIFSS
jgi:tetratricopeptide (TPR) repeat protein